LIHIYSVSSSKALITLPIIAPETPIYISLPSHLFPSIPPVSLHILKLPFSLHILKMYDFTNAPTKNAKGGAMKLCDIQWKHHIPHRVHKQLRKLFITAFIDYPDLVLKECSKKAAKLKFSQNLQTWFTEHDDEKAQDDVDDDDVDDHAEACTTWMAALTRMSPGERYRYAQLLRQSVLKSAKIDKQDPVGSVARMQELLLDGDDVSYGKSISARGVLTLAKGYCR
jgi:hypothetical protein